MHSFFWKQASKSGCILPVGVHYTQVNNNMVYVTFFHFDFRGNV